MVLIFDTEVSLKIIYNSLAVRVYNFEYMCVVEIASLRNGKPILFYYKIFMCFLALNCK